MCVSETRLGADPFRSRVQADRERIEIKFAIKIDSLYVVCPSRGPIDVFVDRLLIDLLIDRLVVIVAHDLGDVASP